MTYSATLTKTGQITIPKDIRDFLGLEPGQRIIFRKGKNSVAIEREKTATEIAEEIDKIIPDEAKKYHMEHFAGMTSSEMQDAWLKTDDSRRHFKEEYERTL